MAGTDSDHAALRRAMNDRLETDELRTICFDLGVSYDNLSGDTKLARTISLLERVERTGRGADLVAWLRENRTDHQWPDPYAAALAAATNIVAAPQSDIDCIIPGNAGNVQGARNSGDLSTGDLVVEAPKIHGMEDGVSLNELGIFTISISPTTFFSNRLMDAFPGVRGLQWFLNPTEAISRLEILLRRPTLFGRSIGHGVTTDPIWWFRGAMSLFVSSFTRLSETRCLLDHQELEIDKLAVYRSQVYRKSFIYIEVRPDESVGVYENTKADIDQLVESHGYAIEEYGLYQGVPITLECYDDGAAMIGGTIVNTNGAKRRVRHLSRWNFLLTSKFHPINQTLLDSSLELILNDISRGEDRFDELLHMIDRLPKNPNDR